MDGFVIDQWVLSVQFANPAAAAKGLAYNSSQLHVMYNSITQKIVDNPVMAQRVKHGRELGSQPDYVVQLLNAVYPDDLVKDEDFEEIRDEIREYAEGYGDVGAVHIPRPKPDGSFVEGLGKIFVRFLDLTAARKFQAETRGRKFDTRVICAAFYPLERFKQGRYVLYD